MAGFYPDAPGLRIPYYRDGTTGTLWNYTTGATSPGGRVLSPSDLFNLNKDGASETFFNAGDAYNDYGVCLFFPALRDVVGMWFSFYYWFNGVQWSDDATAPDTGVWHDVTLSTSAGGSTPPTSGVNADSYADESPIRPNFRTNIWECSLTGVRAIRVRIQPGGSGAMTIGPWHLYGNWTAGENDEVRVWHPTLDQEVNGAFFDLAEVAQGETYLQTFRVKNLDASRTAEGIVVGTDVVTDAAVPLGAQITYSIDGGAYATSLNIGDLGPGDVSNVITMRYTVAVDADIGLWVPRIVADPAALV